MSQSCCCSTPPEEHKHRKIYERKDGKRRKTHKSFTCDPGKPIFPGGPTVPCRERTGWVIASVLKCHLIVNILDETCSSFWAFFSSKIYYTTSETFLTCILRYFNPICLHSLILWISACLPPCPLTPSLLLDRRALSLPEIEDSHHFTNRGHCNTARQLQHAVTTIFSAKINSDLIFNHDLRNFYDGTSILPVPAALEQRVTALTFSVNQSRWFNYCKIRSWHTSVESQF